jgi:hypothetical protein
MTEGANRERLARPARLARQPRPFNIAVFLLARLARPARTRWDDRSLPYRPTRALPKRIAPLRRSGTSCVHVGMRRGSRTVDTPWVHVYIRYLTGVSVSRIKRRKLVCNCVLLVRPIARQGMLFWVKTVRFSVWN